MFGNPTKKLAEQEEKRAFVLHRITQTILSNNLNYTDIQHIIQALCERFDVCVTFHY